MAYEAYHLGNHSQARTNKDNTSALNADGHIGIDISHYQSEINWQELQQNNLSFVFIKATQGDVYVDPNMSENAHNAKSIKLPFGFYHFFSADEDPKSQAQHFINTVKAHEGLLRPVVDIERLENVSKEVLIRNLKSWLIEVETALSCEVILYTGDAFWHQNLADSFVNRTLWLADYSEQAPHDKWTLWQRSQSAQLLGIQGNVDLNQLRPEHGLETLTCQK